MKKIISLALSFILPLTLLHAEDASFIPTLPPITPKKTELPTSNHQFLYDTNFTPYAGGENLLSLHRTLEKFDEQSPLVDKEGFLPGLARTFELLFAWMPINYATMVVQHEVFGHGYRIRDLGKEVAEVTKYTFEVPPPFGPGGAATHFEFKEIPAHSKIAAISAGGVEATGILANKLRILWTKNRTLPAQESLLYLFSHHDLTMYISSLHSDDASTDEEEGHDIDKYLQELRLSYPEGSLSNEQLKRMAKIGYFDPFTYLSIYSWFHYISSGTPINIPMFNFGSVAYLPSVRLGLSPFGPEYYLDNYLKIKEVSTYVYFKRGQFANNTYIGAGFLNEALFTHNAHSLGLRLDVWHQPKLLSMSKWEKAFTGYHLNTMRDTLPEEVIPHIPSTKPMHEKKLGAAGSLIYNYSVLPERLSVHVELGYKSVGYLAGESLQKGPLAKLALNARF